MIQEYQVRVLPPVAANEQALKSWLADEYGFDVRTMTAVRILRRSIDARQRTIFVNLKVRAYINELPEADEYVATEYPDVSERPQVIVVGAGPGGFFAALRLIELGLRPVVLERGKNVHDRKVDLAMIAKTRRWMLRATTVLARVGQEPIVTESSTPVPRSGETSKRYSTCSASMVPRRISSLMLIRILVQTSCHGS